MRPVLQTVTIGHAVSVRDLYEERRCIKPNNERIYNEIALKKKQNKKKQKNDLAETKRML